MRVVIIIGILAAILGIPFLLKPAGTRHSEDALRLVIISPHGEAIRYEFERDFSLWHEKHYGQPVNIEWRTIGGTSVISKYLDAQMLASFRRHWTTILAKPWTEKIGLAAQNYRLDRSSASELEWEARQAYLDDENTPLDCGIDVFFGGGPYDHNRQARLGSTARINIPQQRPDLLKHIPQTLRGEDFYPAMEINGKPNRAYDRWYGTTLSSFGICVNLDRLDALGIEQPRDWRDLTIPELFGQVAAADPTKSATITKCFEMIVQQQIWNQLNENGIDFDSLDSAMTGRPEVVEQALEAGWLEGLRIVRRISANARYFADSSSKVPIDVAQGNSAVGMCVGFYGRFQSEFAGMSNGRPRMEYVHPVDSGTGIGGSSLNADPLSVMRMDPNNSPDRPYRLELAHRFVHYCLEWESQHLWTQKAGTPNGPEKYTLRRIAVREDYYIPENLANMADPDIQPYNAGGFLHYRADWTAGLFNPFRQLIKGMCIDTADELRDAWSAIIRNGGPGACPEAMKALNALPEFDVEVDGETIHVSLDYGKGMKVYSSLAGGNAQTRLRLRESLTRACREQYGRVARLAKGAQR